MFLLNLIYYLLMSMLYLNILIISAFFCSYYISFYCFFRLKNFKIMINFYNLSYRMKLIIIINSIYLLRKMQLNFKLYLCFILSQYLFFLIYLLNLSKAYSLIFTVLEIFNIYLLIILNQFKNFLEDFYSRLIINFNFIYFCYCLI